MLKFSSIKKTPSCKKRYYSNAQKIYLEYKSKGNEINIIDLENLNIEDLQVANKKKKFNSDFITLWGRLEMKAYIDYETGDTPNLYFVNCSKHVPVKKLADYNFIPEDARKLSLLDIKLVKPFEIEGIKFDTTYIATFEISDSDNNYRPYVLFFMKTEHNELVPYCFGYDSNNNGKVELFMDGFNYPVFLDEKGYIVSPLSDRIVKLNVYDYITDVDIGKLIAKK